MAKNTQIKKRIRQSLSRNRRNSSLRSMLRTAIRRLREAVQSKDISRAKPFFCKATKVIDRVACKKIIHKNKAAREKSRLSSLLKSIT